jgi:hypothetical protein
MLELTQTVKSGPINLNQLVDGHADCNCHECIYVAKSRPSVGGGNERRAVSPLAPNVSEMARSKMEAAKFIASPAVIENGTPGL